MREGRKHARCHLQLTVWAPSIDWPPHISQVIRPMETQSQQWEPRHFTVEEIERRNARRQLRRKQNNEEIAELFRQHPEEGRVLVHVGKCGGKSFKAALSETEKAPFVLDVHQYKPPVDRTYKYWLLIRNPLDRTVSAFRWRYRLVVEEQKNLRNHVEQETFAKYATINDIAEDLYGATGESNPEAQRLFRGIGHIKTNLHFYLSELLDGTGVEQIEHVFLQEYLDEDLGRVLGVEKEYRLNDNRLSTWRDHLSERGAANLRRAIEPDYAVVARLFARGHIPADRMPRLFT